MLTCDNDIPVGINGHSASPIRFIATLALAAEQQAALLLTAISDQIPVGLKGADPQYRDDLDRLLRNLDLSGLSWDGSRVMRRAGTLASPGLLTSLGELGIGDVNQEIERIAAAIETDPADSITASRALVETVCKSVLDELGEPINESEDLPSLYKRVAVALKIDPTQHEVVYRQTLQGLVSAVQGLAELRNKLGDAHGRSRLAARPQPRHARMAAGAAMTVSTFLVETLEQRRDTKS